MTIRRIEGESVERLSAAQVILDLASALKELVENSLDANPTQITINLGNYGIDWFEVIDDGHGINEEDMHNLGRRHHTSKLQNHDEVFLIKSFGFRGEALHSLATISNQIIVISMTKDAKLGCKACINASGNIISNVAASRGTSVQVRGLLVNLPVRLAEWKRNVKRYYNQAIWLIQSYVLAVPEIRFRCTNLVSGGSQPTVIFATSGQNNVSKTFAEVFRGDLVESFSHEEISRERFKCKVYFTSECSRRSSDRQFTFLNKRPCDLPKLLKKVNEVFRSFNLINFPILVVYIETTEMIDVNLTPDKRQVILNFEEELISAVTMSISNFMSNLQKFHPSSDNIPNSLLNDPPKQSSQSTIIANKRFITSDLSMQSSQSIPEVINSEMLPNSDLDIPHACTHTAESFNVKGGSITFSRDDFNKLEVIGQFNCGFILAKLYNEQEGAHQVFIIDQHASDERHRLERFQNELEFQAQSLILPKILKIGLDDQLFICNHLEILKKWGFDIEIIEPVDEEDERIFRIRSLPVTAGVQCNVEELLEMIELIKADQFDGLHSLQKVHEALAYKACRSAIMIGDSLNRNEMIRVIRNLATLKRPWICAHGRPTLRLLYTIQSPINSTKLQLQSSL